MGICGGNDFKCLRFKEGRLLAGKARALGVKGVDMLRI